MSSYWYFIVICRYYCLNGKRLSNVFHRWCNLIIGQDYWRNNKSTSWLNELPKMDFSKPVLTFRRAVVFMTSGFLFFYLTLPWLRNTLKKELPNLVQSNESYGRTYIFVINFYLNGLKLLLWEHSSNRWSHF